MKKTNKLWLALLLTVLVAALLAVGFTAAAVETPGILAQGYCGGEGDRTNLTWVLTDDCTLTISGTGAMADFRWDQQPWSEYNSAYHNVYNNPVIQSVVIEEGVTTIGDCAFYFLDLDSLVLPSGITEIGCDVFSGSLPAVTLPDSLELICAGAFNGAVGLRDVYYTGSEAQWNQISIASNNNENLLDNPNLTIHYNVADWGYCGGEGDGTNVTWVLDNDGTLTINGSGYIRHGAFQGRTDVKNVVFLDGTDHIGANMFAGCSNLESITIPYTSMEEIEVTSVADCDSLSVICYNGTPAQWDLMAVYYNEEVFGGSYAEYAQTMRAYIKSLVQFADTDWGYCGGEGDGTNLMWELSTDYTLTISGTGEMANYTSYQNRTTAPWDPYYLRLKAVVLQPGVTSIGDSAFYDCTSLESVTIPDGVLSIGNHSFVGCFALTSVTIPDGVTSIPPSAFATCLALTSVMIPDSVTSIDAGAFSYCTALQDVYYGGSEAQWGEIQIDESGEYGNESLLNANIHYNVVDWGYCGGEGDGTNLTWVLANDGTMTISGEGEMTLNSSMLRKHADEIQTVVIEEGATNIADDAFYDCRIMTGITIPDSVTSIGYEAFSGCWSLADITIPNTVTSIGDDAFEGCKSLTSIAIPESMTSISHSLFLACISLTDITIPNSVTSIGTDAFRACRSLTEITIPDSVTCIGAYAFQKCDSLRSIVIPNGLTSIGRYTFYDCSGLTEITIPDSVTGIGDTAFEKCNSLADVYYTGSEEQWNAITIEDRNTPLTEAAIHFNYHEHTPGNPFSENVVPATCTTAGGYDEVVYCTQCPCECSRTHVTVDPINHKNAQTLAATEATATEHGHTAGMYCPDCETWLSGEVVHNALGAQTVIQAPTETEEGIVDIVCTVCGEHGQYTAAKTEPKPDDGGSSGGFWQRITSFAKGIIDWFLRLFKWFGK